MRKAERLFQIITLLRGRRTVITAEQLAAELEVSERTIYRDMQALVSSGMPIESEAGIGYRLKPRFDIPPLMFDEEELEALLLGVRMVQSWSGKKVGAAADRALNKIHSVLPEDLHRQYVQKPEWLIVPAIHRERSARFSDEIHLSIKQQLKLQMHYQREDGESSHRQVLPLGLVFWGNVWTLIAWCEKREGYRMFRLDRILSLEVTDATFDTNNSCNLQHYWKNNGG
ncbi:MAG: DNA-binding transcriptional regulator [Moraxellaceae bacterium]|nr:MAG: DNA-binding transcriptional regulator [Moraxellaceae bacterium]